MSCKRALVYAMLKPSSLKGLYLYHSYGYDYSYSANSRLDLPNGAV